MDIDREKVEKPSQGGIYFHGSFRHAREEHDRLALEKALGFEGDLVISLSGTTFLNPDYRRKILESGHVIHLKSTPDDFKARYTAFRKRDPYPGEMESLLEAMTGCNPAHDEAHHTISVTGKTPDQIAEEMAETLNLS